MKTTAELDAFQFVDHFVTRQKDGTYVLTRQPEEMEEALQRLLLKYIKGEDSNGNS
jgi:hypothetical protein